VVPIISVVGRSGSGKTTFLERLIPELIQRGYRVGCIKHDAHRFEVDYPGKDTWRLREAGSRWVAIANDHKLAVMGQVDAPPTLAALAAHFGDAVDLILTEGYRQAGMPRIEVVRTAWSSEPLSRLDELLALVTDRQFDVPCPCFGLEDGVGVADLIEQRYLRTSRSAGGSVRVLVDGRVLAINPVVADQWVVVLQALAQHSGVATPIQSVDIQLHST
jgi:molybdopterin-guanine dinucleotide biosynthesis adapter protein